MSLFEKLCSLIILLVSVAGYFIAGSDPKFFHYVYVGEDHVIETMTAVFLIFSAALCFIRLYKLKPHRESLFLISLFFAALICIFGAGEEMSWGQRFFNLETPELLKKHNLQGELNLHNIKIGDYKINKIIFSQLMSLWLIFYFLILPWLYKKTEFFKKWTDRLAVPLPRGWQILVFLIAGAIASQIPANRRWEVLEFCGTFTFFLIFLNPKNKELFQEK